MRCGAGQRWPVAAFACAVITLTSCSGGDTTSSQPTDTPHPTFSSPSPSPSPSARPEPIRPPKPPGGGTGNLTREEAQEKVNRDLEEGQVGYEVPDKAQEGQEFDVSAYIAPGKRGLAEAVEKGTVKLPPGGNVKMEATKVSLTMMAALQGSGFVVRTTSPEAQAVVSDPVANWRWSVTPTAAGAKTLTLSLTPVLEDAKGRRTFLGAATFTKEIDVDVAMPAAPREEKGTVGRFFGWGGWTEVAASMISAGIIGGLGWTLSRRRPGARAGRPR